MTSAAQPTTDALLLTNARFYEAWEEGDLQTLLSLWTNDPDVRCVHPGGGIQTGMRAVEEGWKEMLNGETVMRFSLRNVAAKVVGEVGLVTLVEEIAVKDGRIGATVSVAASNLFLYRDGAWKMLMHHGGLIATDDQRLGISTN
jgi:ketosteroid isomerase-like protein